MLLEKELIVRSRKKERASFDRIPEFEAIRQVQLGIFSGFEGRWMTQRVALPHGLIFVMFIPRSLRKLAKHFISNE